MNRWSHSRPEFWLSDVVSNDDVRMFSYLSYTHTQRYERLWTSYLYISSTNANYANAHAYIIDNA